MFVLFLAKARVLDLYEEIAVSFVLGKPIYDVMSIIIRSPVLRKVAKN